MEPTVKTPIIEYCLYARKSSEDDERQAMSIDSQIKEMTDMALREGLFIKENNLEGLLFESQRISYWLERLFNQERDRERKDLDQIKARGSSANKMSSGGK